MDMAETVVINAVTLTPNPVTTGNKYTISVDIYVLYPSGSVYPAATLYPTPDTGSKRT